MNKNEIMLQMQQNHDAFIKLVSSLNEKEFTYTIYSKWTAGQQAEHIVKAIKPVKLAFSLPLFVPKLLFGKANRPSRSYGELVKKYKDKLAAGGRASAAFIPPEISFHRQKNITASISSVIASLNKKIESKTEEELDNYILPHPLLGKLTYREMLYFTIHHVYHHQKSVEELLDKH